MVAIIGRPNVGKSTLLNRLLGKKLSIVSRKPQTTRCAILGIKTNGAVQTIYVDTPGIHHAATRALNRLMNKAAVNAISGVDVVVFLCEGTRWTEDDDLVLSKIQRIFPPEKPLIVALNKVDLVKDKDELLPVIENCAKQLKATEVIPLSATKNINIDQLERCIESHLPCARHQFSPDQLTDKSDKFLIAEVIREKIIRMTGQEVPYDTAVVVDKIEQKKEKKGMLFLTVTIWVEKHGQKVIMIGKGGEKLKAIGTQARIELEKLLGQKIFLQLWVKIRKGWSSNEAALETML
jgi:GTP-binding protein Era